MADYVQYLMKFNVENKAEKEIYEKMQQICSERKIKIRQFYLMALEDEIKKIENEEYRKMMEESSTITVDIPKENFFRYLAKNMVDMKFDFKEEDGEDIVKFLDRKHKATKD